MPHSQTEALSRALKVGRLLSSTLDLGELLRAVLQQAAKMVDAETASVLLLDEKTGELYFDVALGLGVETSRVRLKLGQGIAGTVAKTGLPEVINDVRSDPRWSPDMDKNSGFTTRSILAVPMTVKGKLLGVVEAINKNSGGFTDADFEALEALASQAAVAIDNARLFSSLQEEKLKLATVFTETADGVILADREGRVILANAAARRFLPGKEEGTLAQVLEGLSMSPSLSEIVGGERPSTEFVAARQEPKPLVLAGRLRRLANGWLCVFHDDTDNWQKEKLKRSFLSLISHKLKTPLTSINGFAEILKGELDETPSTPSAKKAVATIATQGAKLADLVDKLLRYAHLENPEMELQLSTCSLDQVVNEALESLKPWLAERHTTVELDAKPGARVIADRGQLVEVVRNLVENAAKFDPKPEKRVGVRVDMDDSSAMLAVADTGRGIPPEDQEKVFSQFHQIETFFTGQMDGWGLGLPYVKKVVESHGGKIDLVSRLDHGTTITCRFPRAEAKT